MDDSSENEQAETFAATPTDETVRPTSGLTFQSDTSKVRAEHYRITHQIGAGGMGSVLDAEDQRLGRSVAMKVLREGSKAGQHARMRFEREARVLARVEHPNIVPLHEAGRTVDGSPYYTMKLVRGRTLQAILNAIRRGDDPHKLAELLGIFRKICDAVAFAHSRGIVHRDLKPENIMVGEFGEVLVMDWGLAKILGESEDESAPISELPPADADPAESGGLTMEGQVLGTPQYMSPEQSSGRLADIGVRSDIYSLGGILQAIVTLRPPVSGGSLKEIRARIESGDRDPIAPGKTPDQPHCPDGQAPESIVAVIRRAMSLKPDDRYPSADELASEIDSHQSGFATRAENASVMRKLQLYLNRHKYIFLTGIIGLSAATWTFALSLRHLRQEQAKLGTQIRQLHKSGREYQAQVERLAQAVNDFGSLRWQAAMDHKNRFSPAPLPKGWRDVTGDIIASKDEADVEPWIIGGHLIGSPTAGPSALPLPVLPLKRGYRLRLTIRKTFNGGALGVLIPVGTNSYVPFMIEGGTKDRRFVGIELKPPDPGVKAYISHPRLDRQQPHVLDLVVEPVSDDRLQVTASLDDQSLVDWTGSPASAPPRTWNWDPKDKTRLYLGSNGGNWLVTRIGFSTLR